MQVVLAEILIFNNIFGFLTVNWAAKWVKTVNFGCFSFEPKFKILKDFRNTVFVLLRTTSGNFSKIEQFLGEYSHKNTKRGHFMDAESIKKNLNFTTTNLRPATKLNLNKIFQFAKS